MNINERINEAAEAVASLPTSLGSPRTDAVLAIMIVQALDRLTHAVEANTLARIPIVDEK